MDDKIEICRIKVLCSSTQKSMVVSDIRTADKLLSDWAKEVVKTVECQIHIKFEDGFELAGSYLLGRSPRQSSLGHYLRVGMRQLSADFELSAELAGVGALWVSDCPEWRSQLDAYTLDPA